VIGSQFQISTHQRKILQLANKSMFSRAAKNFGMGTKAFTQIDWICAAAQRKISELANKTNSN
jgi:hypothetical protein